MSKKIIITEEEKNEIKSLYKINEQSFGAGDVFKSLTSTIANMIRTGNFGLDNDSDTDNVPDTTTYDDDFYKSILKCLGAEPTKDNMLFMYAWRQSEGGNAKNNPFNTTMKMPGSTPLEGNSAGVQNYKTSDDGVEATCQTLLNGKNTSGYDKIIDGLRNDVGLFKLTDAVINSKWGTKEVLSNVVTGYASGNTPKPHPINKTEV
jgi:hypothetical protein